MMLFLIGLIALVAVAAGHFPDNSRSVAQVTYRRQLDGEWEIFKTLHEKKYNLDENLKRRAIWQNNLQYIQKHNLLADMGLHTFWLGMNKYGDLTNREFVQQMNGYNMTGKRTGSTFLPPSNIAPLPGTVDWREKGYVTPVKDQGQCGSCWAFSSTGSLEGQHFRKNGTLTSLSEQNLIDCSGEEGNMGCDGGLMDNAFEYIKENHGIDTEASYPYKAASGKCKYDSSNIGATDTGFVDIKKGSEKQLKIAVATVGPISVAIDASHTNFQFYKRGVYYNRKCSSTSLDHGVLVVGYGNDKGKDYWLVKNR